jgi:hypothetical protein
MNKILLVLSLIVMLASPLIAAEVIKKSKTGGHRVTTKT